MTPSRRFLSIFLGVVVGGLLAWVLLFVVPQYAIPRDLSLAKRVDAENALRGTLAQVLAGLLLAGGLIYTARTYNLNRQGQVSARFTHAIELMGDASTDVRVASFYALERIARDSPEAHHVTIMEILLSYVREHARSQLAKHEITALGPNRPRPRGDVQAALAVIGRRDRRYDGNVRLDLPRLDLRGAHLRGAHLEGARLRYSRLEGARLVGAHLENARLREANLRGADLVDAILRGAEMPNASLEDANLAGAHLENAKLHGANLRGAKLAGADLQRADLAGASLQGAKMPNARLEGARFTNAKHGAAVYDAKTLWPANFDYSATGAVPFPSRRGVLNGLRRLFVFLFVARGSSSE